MTSITQEAVKDQSDEQLRQIIAWSQCELAERQEKRRQDAIAKIREIAGAVGVTVTIGEKGRARRGRPPGKPDEHRQTVAAAGNGRKHA
jgi:hypothetical protein